MKCEAFQQLLDAYVDGELDIAGHIEIEEHLKECRECSQIYEGLASLRSELSDESFYFRAPADLGKKIQASLRETGSEPTATRWWQWKWMPALAGTAVLASLLITTFVLWRPSASSDDLLAKEIVSAHVRSMMVNHLTDVPSTDQHTVKPWFDGKLDFSPPVIDLAAQNFTLIGGRLDYADGRPVAALVYQRRQHFINLFVFPSQDGPESGNKILVRQGFNIVHWSRSGMTFWAVSDINLNELQEFAQDMQK